MIKNIVFDLGRVMVDFYPLPYLEQFGFDEQIKNKLNKIIFESNDWIEYDRGTYYHNTDLIEKLVKENPDLEIEIKQVLSLDWVKMHYLKTESSNFLIDLKNQGKKIYILSNLSKDSYDFISKMKFFNYIDGGVFSFEERVCKRNEKIYKTLLEKYNLEPNETIFLDDKIENVEAGEKLGIIGVQFSNIDIVKEKINNIINNK